MFNEMLQIFLADLSQTGLPGTPDTGQKDVNRKQDALHGRSPAIPPIQVSKVFFCLIHSRQLPASHPFQKPLEGFGPFLSRRGIILAV
jgi:hypothetical protein